MPSSILTSGAASGAPLAAFSHQWAAQLITYRRDGTPVATAVNIAVLGDRLAFRTYASAWKCRRLEHDPRVQVAPSDIRGTTTGRPISGRATILSGPEADAAARAIDAKYPLFQRRLVRLGHRLLRYRTVHFSIEPLDARCP